MKFPLGKILEIGVPLAAGFLGGPAAAAVPSLVSKKNQRLGYREDPERGHDFAAVGLKQIVESTFPDETVEQVNRIILTWAALLAQEAEQDEQHEREAAELEEIKQLARERRAARRKRKPRGRKGRGS